MKIIPPQKLWQWDINKKVYISGITDADEWQVHFATDDDCTALVLPIKHDDSGYWAYIPNQLVSEGRLLLCYLYNQVEDWAHTETMIKIPVLRRPKPAGYTLVLTDIETRGSLREDIGNLSSLTTQTQNNLVDAINEVNMKKHNDLDGRDAADVHPMSSITGLEQRLQSIDSVGTGQAKAIAQLKQDIETNEATDKSQSQAISSIQQSISSIQSASESNAAAISDMQVSISSINNVDYIQSQAIADAQSDIMRLIDQDTVLSQDIAALENADSTLSQSISSLASSVDSAFAEVETALNSKQPVGNYVTSVNGNAPDEGGNVNINVQTYTAGEGIDISDSGEIAVTHPMDDEQVSETTTWSSSKSVQTLAPKFTLSGNAVTCAPVEGSILNVEGSGKLVWAGGKNLLNYSLYGSYSINGVDIVYNSADQTFTFNGTATATISRLVYNYYVYAKGKTLTISVNMISGNVTIPSGYAVAYVGYGDDLTGRKNFINAYLDGTNNSDREGICSKNYVNSFWFYISRGVSFNNLKVRVQLELGDETTPFEPYIGEPLDIQLPTTVTAKAGKNLLFADTGDVTVTGYEDPRTTIANLSARIAALESAATGI